MNNIKNLFKSNEWNMISSILKDGRSDTWFQLAVIHGIRPDGNGEQRKKSANDVWRKYLKKVKQMEKKPRVLIYDIETSRVRADLWWSGKQYINGNDLISEAKIITIAWKWLGEDNVYCTTWDKNKSDKELVLDFLKEYNSADMVIGYNNDRFDNKFINTRAMKYGFNVNTHVKSFDIMKQSKRLFRLPSYSMNYLAKFMNVATKLQHSGLDMWNAIQYGKKKEAKKAMKLMVKYNVQDIIVTEQVYLGVRKYMKSPIHLGALIGKGKTSCPCCGSTDAKHYKTSTTVAGSIQHSMECDRCETKFKISNTEFLKIGNNG